MTYVVTSVYEFFFRLARCPVCRSRPSSSLGCCPECAHEMFDVHLSEDHLVLGWYRGRLEQAIRALKFRNVTRLATLFGDTLATAVSDQPWQVDLVTPVPLHLKRRLERGYNQAGLVGRITAERLDCRFYHGLTRVRETKQQAKLGGSARQTNVAAAFEVKERLHGEHVLLIDDVMTSGATLTECALALLNAGAGRVYLAAVAKTPSDRHVPTKKQLRR